MLTCTEELFKGAYGFRVFGTDRSPRQASRYVVDVFQRKKAQEKLMSILRAIETSPMMYHHPEKFKQLEKDVWEIKIGQIRIACVWDPKPLNLIAIYGFDKKQDRWPKNHLNNMRRQKELYFATRTKQLGGNYYAQLDGP